MLHIRTGGVFLSKSGSADNQVPADLGVFGKIARLESLRCQAVKVTNVQGLAGLNKLTEVSFSISPIDSLDFVKGTPALENLNLYGFQHSFPDYTPLLHLKNLKHLDIYMNKQATDKNLQPLNGLTTLESISMSNSRAVTTLDFLQRSVARTNLSSCIYLARTSPIFRHWPD